MKRSIKIDGKCGFPIYAAKNARRREWEIYDSEQCIRLPYYEIDTAIKLLKLIKANSPKGKR